MRCGAALRGCPFARASAVEYAVASRAARRPRRASVALIASAQPLALCAWTTATRGASLQASRSSLPSRAPPGAGVGTVGGAGPPHAPRRGRWGCPVNYRVALYHRLGSGACRPNPHLHDVIASGPCAPRERVRLKMTGGLQNQIGFRLACLRFKRSVAVVSD